MPGHDPNAQDSRVCRACTQTPRTKRGECTASRVAYALQPAQGMQHVEQPTRLEQPDHFGRTFLKALGLWTGVGLAVWLAFFLIFSKPGSPGTSSPQVSQQTANDSPGVAKAREVYSQRCVACHGPNGRGDGPASAGLTPKPREFTDAKWQSSVTDGHIENIIKFGGTAVGKSPAMPSNPDLQNDTQVIAGLRTVIREFQP